MTGETPYFQIEHVYKRFGTKVALRDVNVTLAAGEAVALLGANGAGKTTLLRTLATLSRPTRGTVMAFGVDAWSARPDVRARIGVVAHQPYVYPELSCTENLVFFATMFGLSNEQTRATEALERVGLIRRAEDRAATLSRGLLQRLNLARAILHEPAVLVLDEPDTGLDAAGREVLSEIVRSQIAGGGGVVLTTHALEYALELATRVIVLADGRVVLDDERGRVTDDTVAQAIGGGAVMAGR
ncbi:MAG TPA: heme ABC exporter ATP-binding protein CcmA [Thermomicrobiales bacterium]|nr:heme ABC exporter ATP-binding protein CcmA [Thermomicrobiales bacterium]